MIYCGDWHQEQPRSNQILTEGVTSILVAAGTFDEHNAQRPRSDPSRQKEVAQGIAPD
jgi:hypothetical protein